MKVMTPISAGELIDKITILELKTEFMSKGEKLDNVMHELTSLQAIWSSLELAVPVDVNIEHLREVNRALWYVEDELRGFERSDNFGSQFVEKARSVYKLNDRRAAIKREINSLSGSELIEEKLYKDY